MRSEAVDTLQPRSGAGDELAAHGSDWIAQTSRFVQINLAENDGLGTDVDAWVAFWKRSRAGGVVLSAAGATSYYPSKVPLHPRPGIPESADLFERMCLAAKAAGLRVLARFEAQFTEPEVFAAHPEWFRRDKEGRYTDNMDLIDGMHTIRRPGSVGAVTEDSLDLGLAEGQFMPCWNGGYYSDFIPQVMSELAGLYPIDGFTANGWPQPMSGMAEPTVAVQCYCKICLDAWQEWPGAQGRPYPEFDDPADPLWWAYVEFIQTSVEQVQGKLRDHARSIREEMTFVGCTSASPTSAIRWRQYPVDMLAQDCQGRGLDAAFATGPVRSAIWQGGQRASLMRSASGTTPAYQIVGGWRVGHEGSPWLRRLSKDPLEFTILLAQAVAKDLRPWCNVASGTIHDRRWMKPMEDFYSWHYDAEPYLQGRWTGAKVGIVWSPPSIWRTAADGKPSGIDAINGWQLALLRERIPFAFILEDDLQDSDLSAFATIIVPSGVILPTEGAAALKSYKEAGGTLIVGCGAALPGFPDVGFGADVAGPLAARYLAVGEERLSHELLKGLGDTDYIPAGRWHSTGSSPAGKSAGRLVPQLPFYAEKAWYPAGSEGDPLLTVSDRAVSYGTDIDATFGSALLSELGLILANSVRHLGQGRETDVVLTGPGLVDVDMWINQDAVTVHLVNFSSPDAAGGPLEELVPVGPMKLAVRLPSNTTAKRVHLLRGKQDLTWSAPADRDGWIEVEIGTLDSFEVVAIDLFGGSA